MVMAPLLEEFTGRKDGPADALRLLHEDDAERGGRQHVQPGERGQVGLVRGRDVRVLGRELREDDRELAVRDEREPGVQRLSLREAADPPGQVSGRSLAENGQGNREEQHPADAAELPKVDREPEDEEEERPEQVPEAEEALLDLLTRLGPGKDDAGEERPDRLGQAERSPAAAMPTRNAKTASRKNSRGSRSSTRSISLGSQRDAASARPMNPSTLPMSARVGPTSLRRRRRTPA